MDCLPVDLTSNSWDLHGAKQGFLSFFWFTYSRDSYGHSFSTKDFQEPQVVVGDGDGLETDPRS